MSNDDKAATATSAKKAYAKPSLQVYGNVRALTNNADMNNSLDGMATGNTKTS